MSRESLENKKTKFHGLGFIPGDPSDDIKDLIEEIQLLKERVEKLENV